MSANKRQSKRKRGRPFHAPPTDPMGLFAKFKVGLQKSHTRLAHEIKRIVSRSPRLDAAGLEELETAHQLLVLESDTARRN